MELTLTVTLLAVMALSHLQAESISSADCPSFPTVSDVTEVRINPCPGPGNGADVPCRLKRGTSASISVDFIPEREIWGMRAGLSWMAIGIELPFPGLEWNACNSLTSGTCPLHTQSVNTYTAVVKLSQAYPLGIYPLKLRLTDAYSPSTVVLCQIFSIQLED